MEEIRMGASINNDAFAAREKGVEGVKVEGNSV